MRLGIDAREIQNGVYTGIGRSLMHFLRYFDEGMHNDHCVLFSSKPLPFRFRDHIECRIVEEAPTLWWDQVLLPIALKRENIEIFYSPYYKLPLAAGCKMVSSILDVMYLKYPPYLEEQSIREKIYYATLGKKYAHRAARIITSSEYSRKDIVDVYGVDPKMITVIPLGVSRCFRPVESRAETEPVRAKYGIRGRYLLYVGNFKFHKNVATLIRAFALVAPAVPDLMLVLAAPKKGQESLLALASGLNVLERIILTDTITDEEELRLLYAGAEVFILPSLYEGFGIPPVEAMACGVPVICADATCLPETCAGAAVLVEPMQSEAYARVITRIIADADFSNKLKRAGLERVELIREEKFGRRLHDVFRAVAG